MNVLLIPQVFPPEVHPTAIMFEQLARALARAGHRVTVACGYPHHPRGKLLGGYRKRLFLEEEKDRVRVIRVWHLTSTRRSIPMRAAVMASQSLAAALAAQAAERPDVVINIGPPFVGPLAGAACALRFKVPLVTVIFDIYPDVAIATGRVKNPVVIRLARVAEQLTYRLSDRIVVLSEGFRATMLERGVPASKIEVIPVWLETDEVRPQSRNTRLRQQLGLGLDSFIVLFSGTIGLVSGAEVVADAGVLVHSPKVVFLFVGDGELLQRVQGRVRELGATNVRFLPLQPRERLAEVQATADVGLVTLAPGCGKNSVPSKVVGYMAAGRPILASVDLESDTARAVLDAGGTVVPPGDALALARAVDDLASRDLGTAGARSRAAFERDHTGTSALTRYAALLESLAKR